MNQKAKILGLAFLLTLVGCSSSSTTLNVVRTDAGTESTGGAGNSIGGSAHTGGAVSNSGAAGIGGGVSSAGHAGTGGSNTNAWAGGQTPISSGGQTSVATGGQPITGTGGQTSAGTGGQTSASTGGLTSIPTGGQPPIATGGLPPATGGLPPATGGAPPWSPTSFPGLVLWLNGDASVSADTASLVSTWSDLSGNANDATAPVDAAKPYWLTADLGPANHRALEFSAANYLNLPDSASLQFGTADFAIEVVARFTNSNECNLFGKRGSSTQTGFQLLANGGGTGRMGALLSAGVNLSTPASGYNNNVLHVFGLRRTGMTLQIRVDGTVVISQTFTGTQDASMPGVQPFIGWQLTGDVAEIIGYKGSLIDAQVGKMETELKAKYQL